MGYNIKVEKAWIKDGARQKWSELEQLKPYPEAEPESKLKEKELVHEQCIQKAAPTANTEKLIAAFKRIDVNNDGQLSRAEVIKVCRADPEIRELLGLPKNIRQEDGSRDLFEASAAASSQTVSVTANVPPGSSVSISNHLLTN